MPVRWAISDRNSEMNDNVKGVLLIVFGMALFSIQDLSIKYLADQVSLLQIIAVRGIIGSVCLIIFLKLRGKDVRFGSFYPKIAITRAVFFFTGFLSFYMSLSVIKLAEATSLFFMSPFFMTIFAKVILKNQVGLYRMIAVVVGFSGSLLIVKPSFENLQWPMLLPVFCAFTYSLSMILAKISSDKDSVYQQSFHIYLSSFVFGAITSIIFSYSDLSGTSTGYIFDTLWKPWTFNQAPIIGLLLLISFIGSAGILCLISAYRMGSPILNAPTEYVLLIFSLVSGYVVFEEVPDYLSFAGIGLIVASGILILLRETIKKEPVAVEINLRS